MACLPVRQARAWPTVFPTGTTVHDRQRAADGYVLFASLDNGEAGEAGVLHMIDTSGRVVHRWNVPFTPLGGKLLPHGNIVVIGRNNKGAL